MISKKMMIIGGSIAGAAVVTTAIVVPVVLTSSHGGSSTPSVDKDKEPKLTITKQEIKSSSRNVFFKIEVEQPEDYLVNKIKFEIWEDEKNDKETFTSEKFDVTKENNSFDLDTSKFDKGNTERILESDTSYHLVAIYNIEGDSKDYRLDIDSDDAKFTTSKSLLQGVNNFHKQTTHNSISMEFGFEEFDDEFYNVEKAYVEILNEDGSVKLPIKEVSENDQGIYKYDSGELLEKEVKYKYNIYYDDFGDDTSDNENNGHKFISDGEFITNGISDPEIIITKVDELSRDAKIDFSIKNPEIIDYAIKEISYKLVDMDGKDIIAGSNEDIAFNTGSMIDNDPNFRKFHFETGISGENDLIRNLEQDTTYSFQLAYKLNKGDEIDYKEIKKITTSKQNEVPSIEDFKVTTTNYSATMSFDFKQNNADDWFYRGNKVKISLLKDGMEIDHEEVEINDNPPSTGYPQIEKTEISKIFNNLEKNTTYEYQITYDDNGNDFDGCVGRMVNGNGNFDTKNDEEKIWELEHSEFSSRDYLAKVNILQGTGDNKIEKITFKLIQDGNEIEYGKKIYIPTDEEKQQIKFQTTPPEFDYEFDDKILVSASDYNPKRRLESNTKYEFIGEFEFHDSSKNQIIELDKFKTKSNEVIVPDSEITIDKINSKEGKLYYAFNYKEPNDKYYDIRNSKVEFYKTGDENMISYLMVSYNFGNIPFDWSNDRMYDPKTDEQYGYGKNPKFEYDTEYTLKFFYDDLGEEYSDDYSTKLCTVNFTYLNWSNE